MNASTADSIESDSKDAIDEIMKEAQNRGGCDHQITSVSRVIKMHSKLIPIVLVLVAQSTGTGKLVIYVDGRFCLSH